MRRVDEQSYAQRFTPRRAKSGWSESNLERARRMIREGKITAAGREALEAAGADPNRPPLTLHPTGGPP